jgi:hypothetical protein
MYMVIPLPYPIILVSGVSQSPELPISAERLHLAEYPLCVATEKEPFYLFIQLQFIEPFQTSGRRDIG